MTKSVQIDKSDPMSALESSRDVLLREEVVYDLSACVFATEDLDFVISGEISSPDRYNDFGLNRKKWNEMGTTYKLGTVRFPSQDTSSVDHDYDSPYTVDSVGSAVKGVAKNYVALAPYFAKRVSDKLIPLSTNEYLRRREEEEGGSVDHLVLHRAGALLSTNVSREDSPIALGFSSMQLTELVSYVEAAFQVQLPVTLFFDLPTFGDVIDYIEAEISRSEYTVKSMFKCVTYKNGEVKPTSSTKDTQLWCMPPILGSGVYGRLSKQLPDGYVMTEVVSLALYANKMDAPPPFEELVDGFVSTIREHQPAGPYSVCGYSFGATLAHAVSRKLHNVNNLVLLDGLAPGTVVKDHIRWTQSEKVNTYLNKQIAEIANLQTFKSPAVNIALVCAGDTSFFDNAEMADQESLGWKEIEPSLEMHVIDAANHLTIMSQPHVTKVADAVLPLLLSSTGRLTSV